MGYNDIEDYEERIHEIIHSDDNPWYYYDLDEQEKLELQNKYLRKIEKTRNKIADLDIQIAELEDYIARVQEWKNSLR